MNGREPQKDNDLFYTCSLMEYIARITHNKVCDIVNALGKDRIAKIYDLADVYHSDDIERVSEDFIQSAQIEDYNSSFYYDVPDNILNAYLSGEIE